MRAFVAVPITPPESLRGVIQDLGALGPPLRATDSDNLHVTLKFLGDVEASRKEELAGVVEKAALATRQFRTELVGLGVFPHAARPSVVWAGFEGTQQFNTLSAQLETGFEAVGFTPEARTFTAHVTLARLKGRPPRELAGFLEQFREERFGTVTIDRLILFRSELLLDGPHYTALAEVPLARTG